MIMNSCKYKREEFDSASGSIKNQFFFAISHFWQFSRKLKYPGN